jgi:hypothetical protein
LTRPLPFAFLHSFPLAGSCAIAATTVLQHFRRFAKNVMVHRASAAPTAGVATVPTAGLALGGFPFPTVLSHKHGGGVCECLFCFFENTKLTLSVTVYRRFLLPVSLSSFLRDLFRGS